MTGKCRGWLATLRASMLDPRSFCYFESFLTPGAANRLLSIFWHELQWSRQEIVLFGKNVMQPRLTAWYGDPGTSYTYSGLRQEPLPWHPQLQALRQRLQEHCDAEFNSVLANAYRDGSDSMGWHSDDEPELGDEPLIASISLGAQRAFLVRPRAKPPRGKRISEKLSPASGSLLLMRGASQRRYQHAVPKTRREVGLRINLTYRMVKTQPPA